MARYDFGGTLADFVVTSRRLGGLDVLGLSAATLTMWSAQSGGTRYTDLVLNGSAVTSIAVGTDGQVPKFQGPDGVTEMWADGGSTRIRIVTLQGAPGPVGPAGLPGVNAIPANDAVAAYLTAPGATADALTAVVTGRLATDPTPANAAAAAVATKLTEAGVLSGAFPYAGVDDVAFVLLDSAGRKSWLEVASDGSAPARVRALLGAWAAPNLPDASITGPKLDPAIGLPVTTQQTSYVWALVDSAGRVAALVTPDGAFDATKLGPSLTAAIAAKVTTASAGLTAPATPFAAWGDSLTAGGYPDTVASQLGVPVNTYGIGGQGSGSIAARQGGQPALITVTGNTIPASGSVAVTASIPPYTTYDGAGTSSGTGSIAGIPGTLTRDNPSGAHTFTRTTAGTATWVATNTPWVPDAAEAARDKPLLIWVGRNDIVPGVAPTIVATVQAMVNHSTALRRRFLVLEIPPASTEPIGSGGRTNVDAVNAALLAAFPNQFVPVAQYLRGPALADGGITQTAQDTTDISNGVTPTSLRNAGDTLHPTAAGQVLIGKYVAKIIRQKGWVS